MRIASRGQGRPRYLIKLFRTVSSTSPLEGSTLPSRPTPLLFMAEGADLICSQDGCTAKVARDGHLACSTHSPCFVDFRYDPTACPQCECWVQQLRLYPKDTRPAPPPLVSLRAVWQHLKKAAQKRGSPRVEVAVQALALELGLVRARTVSGGTSASPERASSQARQHSTPRRRSRSRIRSISRRSSTSGLHSHSRPSSRPTRRSRSPHQ
ncbi:uncharacterized protein LOC143034249 [Oratosquilla oratoria]|uniref:uncharacterized protein LOC143034249 n=2 Tax=Oratosquilla oratoria TaxID=337810 RepID=UPI003F75B705